MTIFKRDMLPNFFICLLLLVPADVASNPQPLRLLESPQFFSLEIHPNSTKTDPGRISQLKAPKWNYVDNGKDWGNDFPKCNGNRQSPIDIPLANSSGTVVRRGRRIRFFRYDTDISGIIVFNNQTINKIFLDFGGVSADKKPYIEGGNLKSRYYLIDIHFHWSQRDGEGSEHTFSGKSTSAEVHFVHIKEGLEPSEAVKASDGFAVIGVLIKKVASQNQVVSLFNTFPQIVSETVKRAQEPGAKVPLPPFRPMDLLPTNRDTFVQYNGSLTTPPCHESVVWIVMGKPLEITGEQDGSCQYMP